MPGRSQIRSTVYVSPEGLPFSSRSLERRTWKMPRLLCFSKFKGNWNGLIWGVGIIGSGTIKSCYSSMDGRGMEVLDADADAL